MKFTLASRNLLLHSPCAKVLADILVLLFRPSNNNFLINLILGAVSRWGTCAGEL